MKHIIKQTYRVGAALTLLLALIFTSCKKDDKMIFYGPDGKPIEHLGQVIISPEGLPEGELVDFLTSDGKKIGEVPTGVSVDIEAGTYKLMVVTPETGLEIEGTVVSIYPLDWTNLDNPTTEYVGLGNMYRNAPNFRAGVTIISVAENQGVVTGITLHTMTRPLTVNVLFEDFGESLPPYAEVLLTSVAGAVDVEKEFGAVLASSKGFMHETFQTMGSPALSFGVNLLGFASPTDAELRIALNFSSDKQEIVTIPISDTATAFNRGPADVPMEMDIAIARTNSELSGTVTDWRAGCVGDVDGE